MKTKIKTYQDALKALGLDPDKLPDVSSFPEKDQKQVLAHYKLMKIADALNEGWQPDFDDRSQTKYYAWFTGGSSGFAYLGWARSYTFTLVGSRLCFKSADLAEYVGQQFEAIYKEYLIN